MSKSFLFELCADSLQAARAAQAGGASRMELCEDLAIAGITPSTELLHAVLREVSIPVHVLIRPRGGDFVYSAAEFQQMRSEIEQAKAAGASGIAVGILFPDSSVDVKRSRELVELARPMKVTFHRAFDEVRDQRKALEDVILTGADSLLTSGGAPDVLTGAEQIGRLQRQAGDRLEIMAGGGLRLTNLAEVVRQSGVSCLHGSLGRPKTASGPAPEPALGPAKQLALEEDLREAIRLLQQECLQPVR